LPGFSAASVWITFSMSLPLLLRSDRPVGRGILPHNFRPTAPAVGEAHIYDPGPLNDMAVGHYIAVRGYDHPRPAALGLLAPTSTATGGIALHPDVDDRRPDPAHDSRDRPGVGVEKGIVVIIVVRRYAAPALRRGREVEKPEVDLRYTACHCAATSISILSHEEGARNRVLWRPETASIDNHGRCVYSAREVETLRDLPGIGGHGAAAQASDPPAEFRTP
jgi:hypothetical protein